MRSSIVFIFSPPSHAKDDKDDIQFLDSFLNFFIQNHLKQSILRVTEYPSTVSEHNLIKKKKKDKFRTHRSKEIEGSHCKFI